MGGPGPGPRGPPPPRGGLRDGGPGGSNRGMGARRGTGGRKPSINQSLYCDEVLSNSYQQYECLGGGGGGGGGPVGGGSGRYNGYNGDFEEQTSTQVTIPKEVGTSTISII